MTYTTLEIYRLYFCRLSNRTLVEDGLSLNGTTLFELRYDESEHRLVSSLTFAISLFVSWWLHILTYAQAYFNLDFSYASSSLSGQSFD